MLNLSLKWRVLSKINDLEARIVSRQYSNLASIQKYVNYAVYAGNISLEVIEAMLQPLELLSSSLGTVAPQCVDSMYRYQCSQMYAECNSSATGE